MDETDFTADDGAGFERPAPPKSRAFLWVGLLGCGCVAPVVALTVFIVVVGILEGTGAIPPTGATPGADLPAAVRTMLIEEGFLEEDEKILYFYSSGLFSYRATGAFFTDRRVVALWENDGELTVESTTYDDIVAIEPEFDDEFWADSVIVVETRNGDLLELWVSNENGRDRAFHRQLARQWKRKTER